MTAYLYGDPEQADIIKIHKQTGKLTFLHYKDFDNAPLPELDIRIKIDLRRQFVQVFEHGKNERKQLLICKEKYIARDDARLPQWEKFTKKLARYTDIESLKYGIYEDVFNAILEQHGLNKNLNKQTKK